MARGDNAYIVSACRSAIGVLHSGLASFTAPELGALAVPSGQAAYKLDWNVGDTLSEGDAVMIWFLPAAFARYRAASAASLSCFAV